MARAPRTPTAPHRLRQQGMALIVLVFLVGFAATAYMVHALNGTAAQNARARQAAETLSSSKDVLIGYLLDRVSGGERPGDMTYPDRLIETPTADYNGTTDSCAITGSGTSTRWYCLGRLPWSDLGLALESPSENDPDGRMPWYAVSANMLDVCLKEFNPGILNYSWPGAYPAACPGTPVSGVLPHPWLTVRDRYGNVISDRVAAVLIIPGPTLGTQNRPASPSLGDASAYLDSVTIDADCTASVTCVPGTYSNADHDNDFIMADDSRFYPGCNPIFHGTGCDTPYNFNDSLAYITIDDVMKEVVKRAAGEARSLLNSYKSKTTTFPDAAGLGTGSYNSVASTYAGMLPIDVTDTCTCASSTSCTCSFSKLTSISFRRAGTSTWSATDFWGACTRPSTQTCTCTGSGGCRNITGTRNFTCDSSGNCTHNTTGTYIFAPPSDYADIFSATLGCAIVSGNAECLSTDLGTYGGGSLTIGLKEPDWFKDNLWQEYFYYHWSTSSNIQAGATANNASAIIVGAGRAITAAPFASKGSAQTRPSANLNDYLDSAENTDGDLVYDATSAATGSSYNDQVFIVAP